MVALIAQQLCCRSQFHCGPLCTCQWWSQSPLPSSHQRDGYTASCTSCLRMPWALSRWAQSLLVRMQTTLLRMQTFLLCVPSLFCLLCSQQQQLVHIHLVYACLLCCRFNNLDHTCSTVSSSPALVLSSVNAMCLTEIQQACLQAVG